MGGSQLEFSFAPQPPAPLTLIELWLELRRSFFPERTDLDNYVVIWVERKHKTVLGTCDSAKRRVRINRALDVEGLRPLLDALLYHEMCHAVLGKPDVVRGRRVLHGRAFRALEARHPGIEALDEWIRAGGWMRASRAFGRRLIASAPQTERGQAPLKTRPRRRRRRTLRALITAWLA